ncbi:hypothetical protein WMF28_09170 [Sorangium sp. So ce590]|uniref:hypothetical protein n=1 Tax=Sorangium sp. So ce590 TaxID=3133317 RepID=UPI003F63B9A9
MNPKTYGACIDTLSRSRALFTSATVDLEARRVLGGRRAEADRLAAAGLHGRDKRVGGRDKEPAPGDQGRARVVVGLGVVRVRLGDEGPLAEPRGS